MSREISVITRYSNGFMLYIINITRLITKKSFKAIGPAIKCSIYTKNYNYRCYDK